MRNHYIIFALTAILCSCAGQRVESLNKQIDAYWKGMRWRAPGVVSGMVAEEGRKEHLEKVAKTLDKIRIVDHNLVNVALNNDKKSAVSQVSFSYYLINRQQILSGQEVQNWKYVDGNWLLDTSKKNKTLRSQRVIE